MRPFMVAVLALALVTSGCHSVTYISSDPPGASVTINGEYHGETPCTCVVRSTTFGNYFLELRKEGYQPVETIMPKEVHVTRLVMELLFFWYLVFFNVCGPVQDQHYVLTPE